MRLLTLIGAILLAVGANAQDLTYQQLSTVMSAKEIPNKHPQSYLAVDGSIYCVGGEIVIIQSDEYVNLINPRREYGPAIIVNMIASGNKKRGFNVFATVKTANNKIVSILNIDEAISMNEIRGGGSGSTVITESNSDFVLNTNEVVSRPTSRKTTIVNDITVSYDILPSLNKGNYSSFMTLGGKSVTVNEGVVVIGAALYKKYVYLECPTKYAGQSGIVSLISVSGKGSKKVVTMDIVLDSGRTVFVNDVVNALMEGEIYFQ